ncbi:MAG: class I SAM-dependent methyltransferase [Thermodesulfobacteriota bacterium]
MTEKKFDPKKLAKLNNPQRIKDIPPDYICSKLNINKPEVIADIGAGTGFFSIAFLNEINPSRVYAFDISDVMIEWMEENLSSEFPQIIPLKSEENSLPVKDESADLAFMINLHHELENPKAALDEAYRILKPGGKFFIVDWKKEDTDEGPPEKIRVFPEQVADQAKDSGFLDILIFNDLEKHFLVGGIKNSKISMC